jgi:hypothetical protein
MDPLQSTHRVKCVKIMQSDGTLVENAAATWREISEYRVKKSAEAPYQISRKGARVGSILGRLSNEYVTVAWRDGMPRDLLQRVIPNTGVKSSTHDDGGEESSTQYEGNDNCMTHDDGISAIEEDVDSTSYIRDSNNEREEAENVSVGTGNINYCQLVTKGG